MAWVFHLNKVFEFQFVLSRIDKECTSTEQKRKKSGGIDFYLKVDGKYAAMALYLDFNLSSTFCETTNPGHV